MTGETIRTPRGNFHITDMSREQIEAAGFAQRGEIGQLLYLHFL